MTIKLKSAGSLSMSEIAAEFPAAPSNALALSMFYAGGQRVPAGTTGEGGHAIPTSGTISISDFYGASKSLYVYSGQYEEFEVKGVKYLRIKSSGNLVANNNASVAALLVGGGGSGGMMTGGGAGGYLSVPVNLVRGTTYPIVIGDGGSGGSNDKGVDGQHTTAFGLTAFKGQGGGGEGNGNGSSPNNKPYASGGGGSAGSGGGPYYRTFSGDVGQGFPGGGGYSYSGSGNLGGGGGGAGRPGTDPSGNAGAGSGGDGLQWLDGNWYAGGGGGSGSIRGDHPGGKGGQGGGGKGNGTDGAGTAGVANTGGGGGGNNTSNTGYNGGSGVVIIRLPKDAQVFKPDPRTFFNTSMYRGDNDGSRAKRATFGWQPDLVIYRNRDGGRNPWMMDSFRGTEGFRMNDNHHENWDHLRIDANGFTMDGEGGLNEDFPRPYMQASWYAGPEVATTAGTISAKRKTNLDAGFSMISYDGNSVDGATIQHGLGKPVEYLWIVKYTGDGKSTIFHFKTNKQWRFNSDGTPDTRTFVKSTDADTITLSSSNDVNQSGQKYIAYAWIGIPGYSKFDVYNGDAHGNVDLQLDFKPQVFMTKLTDDSQAYQRLVTAYPMSFHKENDPEKWYWTAFGGDDWHLSNSDTPTLTDDGKIHFPNGDRGFYGTHPYAYACWGYHKE